MCMFAFRKVLSGWLSVMLKWVSSFPPSVFVSRRVIVVDSSVAFEPLEYPREEDSHAYSVTTKEELLDWVKNGDQTYRDSLMPLDTRIRLLVPVCVLASSPSSAFCYKSYADFFLIILDFCIAVASVWPQTSANRSLIQVGLIRPGRNPFSDLGFVYALEERCQVFVVDFRHWTFGVSVKGVEEGSPIVEFRLWVSVVKFILLGLSSQSRWSLVKPVPVRAWGRGVVALVCGSRSLDVYLHLALLGLVLFSVVLGWGGECSLLNHGRLKTGRGLAGDGDGAWGWDVGLGWVTGVLGLLVAFCPGPWASRSGVSWESLAFLFLFWPEVFPHSVFWFGWMGVLYEARALSTTCTWAKSTGIGKAQVGQDFKSVMNKYHLVSQGHKDSSGARMTSNRKTGERKCSSEESVEGCEIEAEVIRSGEAKRETKEVGKLYTVHGISERCYSKAPRLRLVTANVVVYVGVNFVGGSRAARDGACMTSPQESEASILATVPAPLVHGALNLLMLRVVTKALATPPWASGWFFVRGGHGRESADEARVHVMQPTTAPLTWTDEQGSAAQLGAVRDEMPLLLALVTLATAPVLLSMDSRHLA
ncbi:hypothetical protein EDB85DRAFT_1898214, partial [Lactarius pseudohatsudake]